MQGLAIPMKFISSLEEKKHLMLFYEDPESAKLLEFLFLKQGLDSGESCIYATGEDSGSIVLSLLRYGIPPEAFFTKKIQVLHIPPVSGTSEEIVVHCKKQITKMLADLKKPFRIVSRIVSDVSTEQGIMAELEIEKCVHRCFEDFGGMIMCPYDISSIEKKNRLEWVQSLYSQHHAVIYLPKIGESGVICPFQIESSDM
jgi:hypothetical protein